MKVDTITCHDVYNHGASLQAFALQEYLRSQGHDAAIIDYKPDYLTGYLRLDDVNPAYDKPVIKWLYIIAKLPSRLPRRWAFDRFTRRHLELTGRFHSNDELKAYPPRADVYIAGSDQIWNTLFPNGKDPAFYLDFVPEGCKRISYAASFATESIAEDSIPFVSEHLAGLDAVSVRESTSLPLLKRLGRDDGVAVCDPCFLLDATFWSRFAGKRRRGPRYLVVYDFEKSPRVQEIVLQIAKEKGLEIYNIGPYKMPYADRNYTASGPERFVQLVRDADFVVSNSFHATVFAMIFHRPFCVINRTEQINERMKSLLQDVHLPDRVVSRFGKGLFSPIDYDADDAVLLQKAEASKQYLNDNLSLQ